MTYLPIGQHVKWADDLSDWKSTAPVCRLAVLSCMGDLADRLNEAFDARNLSQYAVAKTSGVSESYIGKIRNRKSTTPAAQVVYKLAVALGIYMEWLTEGTGPRDKGNPLATVTPLDLALTGLDDEISERTRKAVVRWADKAHPDYSMREWVGIILDINRQVAEGAALKNLRFPEPEDELEVTVTLTRAS